MPSSHARSIRVLLRQALGARTSAAPLAQPTWHAALVEEIGLAKSRLQFALLPRHHQQSHTPPDDYCASQDRDAAIKDDPAQPDEHAGEVHRIARELVEATHHQIVLGALNLKGATRGDKVQTSTPKEACGANSDEDESKQIEPSWTPMSPTVTGREQRELLR